MTWTRARIVRTIVAFAIGSTLGMIGGAALGLHRAAGDDEGRLPPWGASVVVGGAVSGYVAGGVLALVLAHTFVRIRRPGDDDLKALAPDRPYRRIPRG